MKAVADVIGVSRSNLIERLQDGFEIGCDNGEKVRVAFALDCCDREAMSFLATTGGISGEDVRDLMVTAVEHRFGRSIACQSPSNGSRTMAAATSLAIPAASLATSVLNRGRRRSKVHRATEWPKHSCARSSVTTSASVHARMR